MVRGKELAVLDFFLCLAESIVVIIILPVQPMEPAVPGVGIIDILRGDGAAGREAAVDQVQDLFVQGLPLVLGDLFVIIGVFQSGLTSWAISSVPPLRRNRYMVSVRNFSGPKDEFILSAMALRL